MDGEKINYVERLLVWVFVIGFCLLWSISVTGSALGATLAATTAKLKKLSITGPGRVNENSTANYTATALFQDGTSVDVTAVVTWVAKSTVATISGGTLSTREVTGDQTIAIGAKLSSGGTKVSASAQVTIVDVDAVSIPAPSSGGGSHSGRFSKFEGTKTCLQCHSAQGNEMFQSVHYQWKGATTDLVDPAAAMEGKLGGINDFCIFPDINWIGKLTAVDGTKVDGGCARCHAGLGEKPSPTVSQAQLQNIDCLICHSPSYKRKVDLVGGVYRFVPDETAMGTTALAAATDIRLPTKDQCLNCHTKSGGGNNFKRGDLEEFHRNPTKDFDVHMASKGAGGKGLDCLSCHKSTVGHRVAGRGSDLKGRDAMDELSCNSCHSATPHSSGNINKHTARVNCTVCHIPTFAKVAPTDMERDWSLAPEVDPAKKLHDPHMVKQTNVVPEYKFWDGTSKFYNFGAQAVTGSSGRVMMSTPMGDITTPGAKIHAFKHHLGTQPMDPATERLLPLKIGLFFETGQLDAAVSQGVAAMGWSLPKGYTFVDTERYMGIFHEVAPKDKALQCASCHTTTNPRLNFKELGYVAKEPLNQLCSKCHERETYSFSKVHSKHVSDKKYDCSTCHPFSKAR